MLIDIVYSKNTGKVYCTKNSYYYNNKFQREVKEEVDYIKIPSSCLNRLIAKNPNVSDWNITDILEIKNSEGD